jgi:chaperone required for assembly of F1-ATPase
MLAGLKRMSDETDQERMTRLSKDRYERPLPKRFYTSVSISDDNAILLDGRVVKTPMKAVLRLPNRALAKAVAKEWEAQGSHINPGMMPITRYANTAIDRAVSERQAVLAEIGRYAGSDLVCYRAATPSNLVEAQARHWDPVVAYAREVLGATFSVTTGIVHVAQPVEAISAVQTAAADLDIYRLTALYNLAALTGSVLLATMSVRGDISADAAWTAAHVDEDYQIATWGEDDEARARRAGRRQDFDGLVTFINLL